MQWKTGPEFQLGRGRFSRRDVLGMGAFGVAAAMLPRMRFRAGQEAEGRGDLRHADRGAVGQPDPRRAAEGREGARHRIQMVGEGAVRRLQPRHARICARRLRADRWATPSPPSANRAASPRNFPKSAFLFGSGAGPAEPNFGVFDNWIHEPAYLSGLIAGKMTKSNVVGAVAAMDIPEVNRLVNAFFCRRQGGQSRRQEEGHLHRLLLRSAQGQGGGARADRRRRRRHLCRALRRHRGGGGEEDPRHLQHVRPVEPRARHGDHRPGLGHVADGRAGHQAGAGRRLHGAGLRRFLAHGQGRLLPRALPRLRRQAAGRRQGSGREARRTEILEGNFRVDVDENTPVSD